MLYEKVIMMCLSVKYLNAALMGGLNGYIIDYFKDYIFDREYSLHLLIHSVSH